MTKIRKTRLSICIPTYNFGEFIGQTLQSIIEQAGDEVEIVIGDGASTDNTKDIVSRYQADFPSLTYRNFGRKGGVDLDIAKTVELARGDYCWLMSADDVLKPGAISRILSELQFGHAIYLCNRTDCDRNLVEMAHRCWLSKKYDDSVFDFSDNAVLLEYLKSAQSLGALFSYLSSIIVRREDWESMSNNEIFMGGNYAHAYKLFSIAKNGGKLKYIKESLVSARFYNDSFMSNGVARRFSIDLDGYQLLADHLFSDEAVQDAFKAVIRREHKWYYFAGLANKVTNRDEWDELERKLRSYGYHPAKLYIARKFGTSNRFMAFARYFRRTLLGWL
ncbi:MAG: glycosyltransferase family 2 protein [Chloroflexi bacterium]|nr:glycosyltransferase family 2 protein [Chloroflexota bacterium]